MLLTSKFIVERRVGKPSVRVTIGLHGEFTPTLAREQTVKYLSEMSKGINPNIEKLTNKSETEQKC